MTKSPKNPIWPDRWPARNRSIAERIRPGEHVLDIGAGSQGLKDLLPEGCEYWPLDTPHIDFNQKLYPDLTGQVFDVAVIAGVLEYLDDPVEALGFAHEHARRLLVSYEALDGDVLPVWKRRRSNWRSHLTPEKIREAFGKAGWTRYEHFGMFRRQELFECSD